MKFMIWMVVFMKQITKYAIAMAVAKRARQITTDALIHGVLLDKNAVDTATKEFNRGEFSIVSD